jgi:S-adenosylmethionine decarboxylase
MKPVGTHCLLELFGCPAELLDDAEFIGESLREAATLAKSTLLQEISHRFLPHGLTALALLAESHIAIHTWPEHRFAAIDIFTCGPEVDPEKACGFLTEKFRAETHSLISVPRGFTPEYDPTTPKG